MSSIHPIESSSVRSIQSAQVIVDIVSAVKELIENGIDAGSSSIEVVLRNHGLDLIQVKDNGSGIQSDDFHHLAKLHRTSKLESFHDLSNVATLGFRGEALASLNTVSGAIEIITATPESAPVGAVLKSENGHFASTGTIARTRGTTVSVSSIFASFPVRQKALEKSAKKELARIVTLLQTYAIALPHIRFSATHILGTKSVPLFISPAAASSRAKFAMIFGQKALVNMSDFDFQVPTDPPCHASGFVSDPNSGRASGDRQFFFLNKRPFHSSKLARMVNEVYKEYGAPSGIPSVVLFLQMPAASYDVNVTPDKRTILFHAESSFLHAFSSALGNHYSSQAGIVPLTNALPGMPSSEPCSSLRTDTLPDNVRSSAHPESDDSGNASESQSTETTASQANPKRKSNADMQPVVSSLRTFDTDPVPPKRPRFHEISRYYPNIDGPGTLPYSLQEAQEQPSDSPTKASSSAECEEEEVDEAYERDAQQESVESPMNTPDAQAQTLNFVSFGEDHQGTQESVSFPCCTSPCFREDSISQESTSSRAQENQSQIISDGNMDEGTITEYSTYVDTFADPAESDSLPVNDHSKIYTGKIAKPALDEAIDETEAQVNMASIAAAWRARHSIAQPGSQHVDVLEQAGVDNEQDDVEEVLTRSVHKEDFVEMDIIGQFNLGFIIVRRKVGNDDDLFIVDQHASDEIFNFERYTLQYSMESQRLLAPIALDLGASGELIALENEDVLERNGFKVDVDSGKEPGRRLVLTTLPTNRNVQFTVADFEELIQKLGSDALPQRVRPSRVRRILASRACRTSVMIGHPLTREKMRSIISNMGQMDRPWACPHGRPTIRWLANLSLRSSTDKRFT